MSVRTQPSVTLASGNQTASLNGADFTGQGLDTASELLCELDVTTQGGTTPTLDVEIQAKLNGMYYTLCRFSRYSAATGRKVLNIKRDLSFATEIVPLASPTVGNGLLNNASDWYDTIRAAWAIGGSAGPNFTFTVNIYPIAKTR